MMKRPSENNLGRILTLSFAHLVHDVPTSFLAPILPLLIDKFGLSVFMAGLLDVFRRIPALANPFLGLLADRMCIKYFIILTRIIKPPPYAIPKSTTKGIHRTDMLTLRRRKMPMVWNIIQETKRALGPMKSDTQPTPSLPTTLITGIIIATMLAKLRA